MFETAYRVMACRVNACVVWIILPCCLAQAGDDPPPSPVSSPATGLVSPPSAQTDKVNDRSFEDLWSRSRLTGDWGGSRTELEEAGLSLALYYNSYFGVNAHGGLDTNNAHRFSGS